MSLQEAWEEIGRLRHDLDRVKSQRLNPRFGGIVLDAASVGSAHYPLGFEPRLIVFLGNFAASSTVATLGIGAAVVDETVDGGIYQFASGIRRSSGGQFRSNSLTNAWIIHGSDSSTPSQTLAVDSFDIDGFTYTLAGGSPTALRGFAMGF